MPTKQMNEVLKVLDWIKENIQLTKMGAKEHGARAGERTPGEVLKTKRTNYVNTCIDLTMATVVLLREKGFEPVIVAQERVHNVTKRPIVHFMIELPINREVHNIDFKQGKVVVLKKGPVDPKTATRQKHLALHRFPTTGFLRQTKPFEFMGFSKVERIQSVFSHVSHADVVALVKSMEKADRTKLFNRVKNTNKRVVRG